MAFDVRIDIREAAALADAFDKSPKIVTEELTAATWEASLLLEREVKENTPTGVGGGGGLKGSISAREPQVLSDNVIGMVGTPLAHAVPVELGTRPHFPPVQPLADWAEHKLGLSPAEAQGLHLRLPARSAAPVPRERICSSGPLRTTIFRCSGSSTEHMPGLPIAWEAGHEPY